MESVLHPELKLGYDCYLIFGSDADTNISG